MTFSSNNPTGVYLGNEYDKVLLQALKEVLSDLGGVKNTSDWGMAGSQEIERAEFIVGNETLTVEAETYVGLTIFGSAELTNRVKTMVESKLSNIRSSPS